jgi:hypothetical protein
MKNRKEIAKELAPIYKDHPLAVARVCDEVLDRSGALLGYVRYAAMVIE